MEKKSQLIFSPWPWGDWLFILFLFFNTFDARRLIRKRVWTRVRKVSFFLWIFPSYIDLSKIKISNGSLSQIQVFSNVNNSPFFTHRQTGRQTDRQTERQTYRQTTFFLVTFRGISFFLVWRKKDSTSVSTASSAALIKEDTISSANVALIFF